MKSKKGQISNLSPSIIGLVVAIIILVLGVVIIQNIRDIDVVTKANSATVINESTSVLSGQNKTYNLAKSSSPACSAQVTEVINNTRGFVITGSGFNYSVSGCVFKFLPTDINTSVNNTYWNITYSYTYGDVAFTSSNNSLVGLGSFADFIAIIVLAVIAAIIIGLILSGFAMGGKQR